MASAKEAEAEWIEHKMMTSKATSVVDPGKKEREELKSRIDKLTAELNKKDTSKQCKNENWKGKKTPTSSPRDLLKSKGPGITSASPFHEGRRPLQCHSCGGWGHVKRECATPGNVDWEELNRVKPTPSAQEGPESTPSEKQ